MLQNFLENIFDKILEEFINFYKIWKLGTGKYCEEDKEKFFKRNFSRHVEETRNKLPENFK